MDFLDKFKATALEGFLKNKFGEYLQDNQISVELDCEKCKCTFKATLAGESAPVTIDVKKFEVKSLDGGKFLCITDVSCDRKWVDLALNGYLKNRDIKLPSFIASAL